MSVKLVLHVAGAAAGWLAFVLQGVVAYLGLLGYAALTGHGRPRGGPFIVTVAAVVGVAVVLLVLLPAVLVGGRLLRDRQWFARSLGALGVAAGLLAVYLGVAVVAARLSVGQAGVGWVLAVLSVLFPLGAYTGLVYGLSGRR